MKGEDFGRQNYFKIAMIMGVIALRYSVGGTISVWVVLGYGFGVIVACSVYV